MTAFNLRQALRASIAVLALNGAVAGNAIAEETPRERLIEAYGNMQQMMGNNSGQAFSLISQFFMTLDRDSNGISSAELELAESTAKARNRSQIAARMLAFDLNGDFIVTKDEIVAVGSSTMSRLNLRQKLPLAQLDRQREHMLQKYMANDANGNGSLEGKELYAVSDEFREIQLFGGRNNFQFEFVRALLDADPNADGLITEEEALKLLADIIKDVPEIKIDSQQVFLNNPNSCPKIEVSKESQLYLVSGYEGQALSTVSIAGKDRETSAVAVHIEDGDGPLTVALASYEAMIWTFTGKTDRIEKVIATSQQRGLTSDTIAVGVVGVPKEKIVFSEHPRCLAASYKENDSNAVAKMQLKAMTGAEVKGIVRKYELGNVALPSGKNTKARVLPKDMVAAVKVWAEGQPKNPLAAINAEPDETAANQYLSLAENLQRYNQGGIANIDANSVVGAGKVEAYDVLPQEAGLLQLVMAGKLEQVENQTGRKIFRVIAPMQYPAGLAGGHSVQFLLKTGVEMPKGDPSHSCVRSEDSQEILDGMTCR